MASFKKNKKQLLVGVLFVSFLTGIAASPEQAAGTVTVPVKQRAELRNDLRIKSIKRSMSKNQVIKILGKPKATIQEDQYYYSLVYDDLKITMSTDAGVSFIEALNKKATTPLGLKLGDPRSKVTQLYGKRWKYWNEPNSFLYVQNGDVQNGDALLIRFKNGKVSHLLVGKAWDLIDPI